MEIRKTGEKRESYKSEERRNGGDCKRKTGKETNLQNETGARTDKQKQGGRLGSNLSESLRPR